VRGWGWFPSLVGSCHLHLHITGLWLPGPWHVRLSRGFLVSSFEIGAVLYLLADNPPPKYRDPLSTCIVHEIVNAGPVSKAMFQCSSRRPEYHEPFVALPDFDIGTASKADRRSRP